MKMHVILVSSEVFPFAKTGGLADVCGALPAELERLGIKVSVFMPAYRSVFEQSPAPQPIPIGYSVPLGRKVVDGGLLHAKLPDSDVDVYFVNQPNYFHRNGLYGENGSDYEDNSERFIFFCRAVLESIRLLNLQPDLVHCNDWQTGLIPALLKCEYHEHPYYESLACLLTIHNIAYQGNFWHWDMLLTGLDWKHFTWKEMEHFGRLNFLKTGIVFADAVTTVSPTYAQEIQNQEFGCGLDGTLRHRSERLMGILNGIDVNEWNPATDKYLPTNYHPPKDHYSLISDPSIAAKAQCKLKLQADMRLGIDPEKPLIGIVGRLVSQKGWSLILPVMRTWLERLDVQWVVLGSGDSEIEQVLTALQRQYPYRLAVYLGFSTELAHRIEAGADIFLMPSQYEPCGLNQMYSMAYGTIPVVRRTGGLADTVIDANVDNLRNKTATGFTFDEYSAHALENALVRAIHLYAQDPESWRQLMSRGMARDWSWAPSATKYAELYRKTIRLARGPLSPR
jgi:starch synthase